MIINKMTTPFNIDKEQVQKLPKLQKFNLDGPLSSFVISELDYNENIIKHRLDSMKKIESDVIVLRKLSHDLSSIVIEQSPNIKKIKEETKKANESTKNAVKELESVIDSDESCSCYKCSII
jgi:hypothetical protein